MGDRMRQIRVLIAVDDFLPSREFQNRVPDLRNRAAVEVLITRFYTQLLRRDPEPDGLDAWTDFVVDTGDLEPVVVGFLISAEFEAQPPTFRGYLTLLYRALLGREPDPGGLDAWEAVLRAALLGIINDGFVPSTEFQAIVRQLCG